MNLLASETAGSLIQTASCRQAPPGGSELAEVTPRWVWPSVIVLQWPTYQDFTQTVPNAPSSQSRSLAPTSPSPVTSLTARAPGRWPGGHPGRN